MKVFFYCFLVFGRQATYFSKNKTTIQGEDLHPDFGWKRKTGLLDTPYLSIKGPSRVLLTGYHCQNTVFCNVIKIFMFGQDQSRSSFITVLVSKRKRNNNHVIFFISQNTPLHRFWTTTPKEYLRELVRIQNQWEWPCE